MTDFAKLGIQVTSQGVDKAVRELRQLEQVGKNAGSVADALSGQAASVSRGFDDMGQAATRAAAGLGRMLGLSAGAALTAFGYGLMKAKDQILEIAKLAEDTRLGPGLVSGLLAGARGAGSSESEVTSALNKFSEVSKKAKDDAEAFYKALSNISPSLATAFQNAGSQEERLRLVSDALRSTTDEVKRAQLAQEAFGTDSESLMRVLGAGSDEITRFANAARAMGMSVDADMIQKAREADKAIADLGNVVSGNLRMALADLAPAIATASGGLAGLTAAAVDAVRQISSAIQLGAQALGSAQTAIPAPATGPDGLTRAERRARLNSNIRATIDAMPGAQNGVNAPNSMGSRADEIAYANEIGGLNQFGAPLPTSRPFGIGAGPAFRPRPSLTNGGGGSANDNEAESSADRALRQLEERNNLARQELATMGLSTQQREAALAYERALNVAKRDGEDLTTEQLQKLREASDEYGRMAAAIEKAKEAQRQLKELSDFARSTFSGFFQDIGSGLSQGKGLWESFAQAGVNALNKIASKLMDMAAQQLWNAAFGGTGGSGGLFGSLLGGLFGSGGGSTGTALLAKGGVFANDNLVPFAKGGAFTNSIVTQPTVFPFAKGIGLMGEAGPEAIMPLRRTPDGRLGVAGMGGGGNVIHLGDMNVTIQGNADEKSMAILEARLQRHKQELRQEIPGIVTEAKRGRQLKAFS